MSMLLALAGTLDPCPMQDAKVSDVVNDGSKVRVMVAVLDQAIDSRICSLCQFYIIVSLSFRSAFSMKMMHLLHSFHL
jgi:hypothetical protein